MTRIMGWVMVVGGRELSELSLLIFIERTTKIGGFPLLWRSPFGCMLFNHFNIYLLIVLRVPCAYATSAFSDLKVNVYGMKGKRLWDER